LVAADNLHFLDLQHRGQCEDIARVIVNHENFATATDFCRDMLSLEHGLLIGWQISDYPMQKESRFVQQPLWRAHVLNNDTLRHALEPRLFGLAFPMIESGRSLSASTIGKVHTDLGKAYEPGAATGLLQTQSTF
jgi:hypothetical protein